MIGPLYVDKDNALWWETGPGILRNVDDTEGGNPGGEYSREFVENCWGPLRPHGGSSVVITGAALRACGENGLAAALRTLGFTVAQEAEKP